MKRELHDLLVEGAAGVGITVSDPEAEKLLLLAEELLKWNRKVNLTAITDEREVVLKHLVDSLSVLPFLPARGRLVDLGSGGGFPCLVVAILRPELEIVSVDSVEKKIFFQKHAARLLSLANVAPTHVRAEALAATRGGWFDTAVSRAFAALPLFVRLAKPLVREGGTIVAMKGREGREEVEDAREELAGEGVEVTRIVEFPLPMTGDGRTVVTMKCLNN